MPRKSKTPVKPRGGYDHLVGGIAEILASARRATARTVNSLMTVTYWEVGRRIVEFEQRGAERAENGTELLKRLSLDLTARFGRGFGAVNLNHMKRFYLSWPPSRIFQTLSKKSNRMTLDGAAKETPIVPRSRDPVETLVGELALATSRDLARAFPLP